MVRRSIAERLAQLDAQKKTLQARLGKQDRANDTRRKVLLGALVLQRLETSHDADFSRRLEDWLRRELPGFLTREGDRELFADLLESPSHKLHREGTSGQDRDQEKLTEPRGATGAPADASADMPGA